jgi:multidrug resistance efflux pump
VAETRCRLAVSDKEKLEAKVNQLEKDKKSSDKKLSQQQSKLTKLTSELKEEKEVLL